MSSQNISFDNIPSSIRKPGKYIEFNDKLAVRTLPANEQKVLLIGQRTSEGLVSAGVLTNVFSDAEAAAYTGYGSQLHLMARAAIKTYPYIALQFIALDDASGSVASTGTITVAGTATSAGALTVNIANNSITVAIDASDTPTDIATAIVSAITAATALPVKAANTAGVVTLTAKNKGALGNQIKVSTSIVGASDVSSTVEAMANGATDPDIADTLAAVFTAGHTIIAPAYNDSSNLQALRNHMEACGGPLEKRGVTGFAGHTGTLSGATTLAAAVNGERLCIGLVPSTTSLPFEVAAAFAALAASEEDPARPLNGLEIKGIGAIPLTNNLGRVEQENALHNGVTPFEIGPGDKVQIVRAVTTYTTNEQGVKDIAWLDLTSIRTMDYVRKSVETRWSLRFPREKLSTRTPPKVRSETMDVLLKLEDLEIIENVEENKDGLITERDLQDPNRLNVRIPADLVNGLHVMAGVIDMYL